MCRIRRTWARLLPTVDVAGVHGVSAAERRAAGITATVSNASAGAVEHLRIAQVINLTWTRGHSEGAAVVGGRAWKYILW